MWEIFYAVAITVKSLIFFFCAGYFCKFFNQEVLITWIGESMMKEGGSANNNDFSKDKSFSTEPSTLVQDAKRRERERAVSNM